MSRPSLLKQVVLDVKLGGGAPPFVWQRMSYHMNLLKMNIGPAAKKIRFAVDETEYGPAKFGKR